MSLQNTYVDAVNPKMIVFGGGIGIWNIIRIKLSLVGWSPHYEISAIKKRESGHLSVSQVNVRT